MSTTATAQRGNAAFYDGIQRDSYTTIPIADREAWLLGWDSAHAAMPKEKAIRLAELGEDAPKHLRVAIIAGR